MPSTLASLHQQALTWLLTQGAPRVDEALSARLAGEFPALSARLRRQVLLESGLELEPLVEGVRQDTIEHLDATLGALADEYEQADAGRRARVRGVVIEALQHTRLAATRKPKDEELLLLRTWLENPLVFTAWLKLRRRRSAMLGKS
jgi:hypothetical protein